VSNIRNPTLMVEREAVRYVLTTVKTVAPIVI